jgi:hypothetical protein
MKRYHYAYGRDRYLTDPEVLASLAELHRDLAAAQARELGLLDPDGPGSWTHPDHSRLLHIAKRTSRSQRARPDLGPPQHSQG